MRCSRCVFSSIAHQLLMHSLRLGLLLCPVTGCGGGSGVVLHPHLFNVVQWPHPPASHWMVMVTMLVGVCDFDQRSGDGSIAVLRPEVCLCHSALFHVPVLSPFSLQGCFLCGPQVCEENLHAGVCSKNHQYQEVVCSW